MGAARLLHVSLAGALAAIGWASSAAPAAARVARGNEITYNKDVAPILFRRCAQCHRPGDIAPFSVLTYDDVRPRAEAIRRKVAAREMPPWDADPRYGDFSNAARLTQAEIDTIVRWAATGAKEGDPAGRPSPPAASQGWQMGRPDLVLAMSEAYTVEAHAPDTYVYVTFPMNVREDRWVQAVEIHPGNARIVHHVIAHVLTPQAAAASARPETSEFPQADSAPAVFFKQGSLSRVRPDAPVIDDGERAPNGGSLFPRRGEDGAEGFSLLLGSYAPGKGPDVYPPGTAKRIPAGSTVALQIHYSSFHGHANDVQKDRTMVGLIFAKAPPARRAVTFTVPNHLFRIPPGAANHRVTAGYTFERDVQLISYMPHMHARGRDMKYEAVYPGGRRQTLLWVPRFHFNWQTVYRLRQPVEIPKGTRIVVTAHFDNSIKNADNPDPAQAVRWGDPTSDEMMIGWLEFLVANGA